MVRPRQSPKPRSRRFKPKGVAADASSPAASSSSSSPTTETEVPAAAAAAAAPPWVDLLESLTEMILERLPLPDYVRFAAVCPKWRSIQREHRLRRHSPVSLLWLCSFPETPHPAVVTSSTDLDPLICYNPFEARFYRLPSPEPSAVAGKEPMVSSHGWLILRDLYYGSDHHVFVLLHPVSGHRILLPPVDQADTGGRISASMSAPPTDPDCILMIAGEHHVFLWRAGECDWTKSCHPAPLGHILYRNSVMACAFCGGIFYGLCLDGSFFAVDPFRPAHDSVELLDMDWSLTPFTKSVLAPSSVRLENYLVDCNGDLMLVILLFLQATVDKSVKGLQVYKADFSKKMWAELKSLDDHLLFVSEFCSFSTQAEGLGNTKNCVYFKHPYQDASDLSDQGRCNVWTGVDLELRWVVPGPPIPDTCSYEHDMRYFQQYSFWIMPSLAPVNVGPCEA